METFSIKFVEQIPDDLKLCTLYISIKFRTVAHLCACGCKKEVFTPISRDKGWVLEYDGKTASLTPSIGNNALDCKSHYFIKRNMVEWCYDSIPYETNTMNNRSIENKNLFQKFFEWLF